MMIDTVIFDVGMVLAEFRWKAYLESFGFDSEINEKVANATVLTSTWNEFDRGKMTEEELMAEFIAHDPSVEKEILAFFRGIEDIVRVYGDSEEWVRRIKERGYEVYILSNYPEMLYRKTQKNLTFLKDADGALFSFQEKVIKPEPEIYEILLERYSIEPEHAVFLDDVSGNLEEAKLHGLHTIHVGDRKKAQKELELLLKANDWGTNRKK